MKKIRTNKKGFTLAELLIVVAIIGVLVAISIPIFTSQLEKAREATDLANIRSAYAEVTADYLTSSKTQSKTVTKVQTKPGWEGSTGDGKIAGVKVSDVDAGGTGEVTVSIDADGTVHLGKATISASDAASTPAPGEGH